MAIMNLALLALLPAVLARPQVGHGDSHRAFHIRDTTGTGVPGAFSHAASGTAPFPVPGGNGTSGAATGSSGAPSSTANSGPVYITSVINVIPTPITQDVTDSAGPTGGQAGPTGGLAGTGGAGGNSGSGSQQTGGAGGAGGSACGPATVTITQANTVTVTVAPSSGGGAGGAGGAGGNGGQSASNGGAGAQSQAPISSAPVLPPVSSAPFPIGNSSVPAGTGTGVGTGIAVPTTSSSSQSVAAVEQQSTSSSVPAGVPTAQPYQSVAEKVGGGKYHGGPPPPVYTPSSVPPPPPSSSPVAIQAPASSSAAAPAQSSSAASKGSTVGAKGVAYNTPSQATQIGGLAWACNWGQIVALESPPFEYVPQLWGKKDGMVESIAANAAGAKACLFYNEPDKTLDVGGSQVDVGTAITDFTSVMKPIQAKGTKVSTPCVANDASAYMNSFVSAFPKGSIDIMCFHWYGPDVDGLKGTVATFQAIASQYGIKELWINEWAVQPAPQDLSSFTSYLDGAVTRYAYNMNDIAGSTGY